MMLPTALQAGFLRSEDALTAPPQAVDAWLLGTTLPLWAAEGLLVSTGTWPTNCFWCGEFGVDSTVRNAVLDPNTKATWKKISDYGLWPMAGAVGVVTVLASLQANSALPLLPISEGLIMAGTINAITKALVARPRPYTLNFATDTKLSPSDLASFTSGHASFAFSLATTFVLTGDAMGWSPWYTAPPGFAMASLIAYARIAADKHWLTDVVGGALTGVGGVLLAWWLRQPAEDAKKADTTVARVLPYVAPQTAGLLFSATF